MLNQQRFNFRDEFLPINSDDPQKQLLDDQLTLNVVDNANLNCAAQERSICGTRHLHSIIRLLSFVDRSKALRNVIGNALFLAVIDAAQRVFAMNDLLLLNSAKLI